MRKTIAIFMSVLLFACSGPQSKDSLRDAVGLDESESKTPITDLIRNETEVLLQDQLDAKKSKLGSECSSRHSGEIRQESRGH